MEDMKLLSLKPVEEATPIDDIQQIIKHLFEGKVLRVDQDDDGVVLVRVGGKHPLTEISREVDKETFYYKRYWLPYNVSINALVTYNVYLDEEYIEHGNKFSVGDIIEYDRRDKVPENNYRDVAKVQSVLQDENGKGYYYKLSGDMTVYREEELTKAK
uniref:Virion structural protein n=1 Tax=Staphylococcus phage UHP46 TaxID=3234966 RepID=A0AB39C8H5_9CAUD